MVQIGSINNHTDVDTSTASPTEGQYLRWDNTGGNWVPATLPEHGELVGLADDDPPQYLTEARHDALPQDNPHNVTAAQVGLGNVDNTSDADKPVSTAQQDALDLKTDLTTFNTHASRHLPSGADPLATAIASGLDGDTTNTEGSAESFSRSDHTHSIATGNVSTLNPDQANAEGSSANLARADHIHNVPTDVAVELTPEAGNAEGASTSFARADHVHNIPSGAAATLGAESNAARASVVG